MIVAAGVLLPFSPLSGILGFVPLPGSYFAYLTTATIVYLFLVEFGKRVLIGSKRGIMNPNLQPLRRCV